MNTWQEDYPRSRPLVRIPATSGLGDEELKVLMRRIGECLDRVYGEGVGGEGENEELCCLSVVECVLDELDRMNERVACAICLSPLFEEEMAAGGAAGCPCPPVRTPCSHPFHAPCLAEWWLRQEEALGKAGVAVRWTAYSPSRDRPVTDTDDGGWGDAGRGRGCQAGQEGESRGEPLRPPATTQRADTGLADLAASSPRRVSL
jgi:hypothetical protein